MKDVRIQTERFDPGAESARLEALACGAVATFTGLVRNDDGVEMLSLEHYPGMSHKALDDLAEAAVKRWALDGVILIHRVGDLACGERIVFVGTASRHRSSALESCAFLIDRLKTDAPFWKSESLAGTRRWVDARESDMDAADRWRGTDDH